MESNFLTVVFLPLALFIIMVSMGLGLTLNDFKRISSEPKSVIIGLIAQLVMLPLVGFVLARIFPLTPELAVGLILLATCPGGPTSNMITYLVRGNIALSITLTAISSLITVFTLPLVVNLGMHIFMGSATSLQLPFLKTVMRIAVITIFPVAIGMMLKYHTPQFAAKAEKWVKWVSLFFLALIIFGLLLRERANVLPHFLQVGWVTFTLNVLTMALGYGIATITKLDEGNVKAITVEVGIQNGSLAFTVASTPAFLNNPAMAIPAAIYCLIMYVTSAAFTYWSRSFYLHFNK
ncbi:MAG: bile acid:sodium symporter family protein [Xenococcaceae cyanobacterium MO_188.B29]|nr:bile acid:sodium symporter family protein [Xenococcaceae cyanobacterium MO_188.B29]